MRFAPSADVAAQAHEGLECLMKTIETSKNLKRDLKGVM
jgi:hypothetical protein